MTTQFTNRDLALGLLYGVEDQSDRVEDQFDIQGQLDAIKLVLNRNQKHDEATASEIATLSKELASANAEDFDLLDIGLSESLHRSTYMDAAHSMSAVGMLAPFVESLFVSIFKILRSDQQDSIKGEDCRTIAAQRDFWNPHFIFRAGGRSTHLVKGIKQLSDSTGLVKFLPDDLETTLSALFAYRNNMFHHGFEWPMEERKKFDKKIQNHQWPPEWFEVSTIGGKPWIFYMSRSFIDHCLKTIDQVLDGFGKYSDAMK